MGQSCVHTMPFKHTVSMDTVIQAIYNTARVTDTPTHPHSHLPPPAPLTHTKHTMQAITHQMSDQQINTGNTHGTQNVCVCVCFIHELLVPPQLAFIGQTGKTESIKEALTGAGG